MKERRGCGYHIHRVLLMTKCLNPNAGFTSEEVAELHSGGDPEVRDAFAAYLQGLVDGNIKGGFMARKKPDGTWHIKSGVDGMSININTDDLDPHNS